MGLSLASSVGLVGHNVLVESIFVGFQLYIPRKQIRIEAEIFSFFFIGKFMDRVTDALDEIKKRKEKMREIDKYFFNCTRMEQALSSIKYLFSFIRLLLRTFD